MSPEEIRRWVAESRRRQGCPPAVQDPAAVRRIARLLRSVEPVSQARAA